MLCCGAFSLSGEHVRYGTPPITARSQSAFFHLYVHSVRPVVPSSAATLLNDGVLARIPPSNSTAEVRPRLSSASSCSGRPCAPRATSALVHLADSFAVAHGHAANPAARDYATKQGRVREPGGETWETKLATLRSFHRAHGHLTLRQDAVWGERDSDLIPIGQLIANLCRKGGLGKGAERAEQRAAQLSAIDEDWCCPWPLNWQRHYRVLADLVDADGILPAIAPGVHFEGDNLGKWLERQKNPSTWAQLSTEQQERLTALGVQPAQRPAPTPAAGRAAKGPNKASPAFQRGVAALALYIAREDASTPVPRGHSEEIAVDGETEPVSVRLGVFISDTEARRDKLTPAQLEALRKLGMQWA